jgi:UDP-N-acetylglucosamine diphosphorylase / glucose-1-phosphate thymidylyltransferase / UDP-N-acetylgalactosamine diphosphorylase / glucosamine-1-phosphate N-acetyltransferase / galactosamine-1-phosphate N-acetyltransferase
MKAVILAAGKGTRMGELTSQLPKPMLPVQGKPVLERVLEGLLQAGIRDFFIVTGFRAEVIENHFGAGEKWGCSVRYGRQLTQDGTGKAPDVAREFVASDDFVLTYGDILVRPKAYQDMLARFGEGAFSGLVTVIRGEDVSKGAINLFDENFCLRRLIEKPSAAQLEQLRREGELQAGAIAWYNAGIYIFKPVVYEFTARLQKSPRGEFELTDAIGAMALAGHRIAGLEIQGGWVDVRDPQVLAALDREQQP